MYIGIFVVAVVDTHGAIPVTVALRRHIIGATKAVAVIVQVVVADLRRFRIHGGVSVVAIVAAGGLTGVAIAVDVGQVCAVTVLILAVVGDIAGVGVGVLICVITVVSPVVDIVVSIFICVYIGRRRVRV
jgi:hypothetical protein